MTTKIENFQTLRSTSQYGDLTKNDFLKRIHDLEIEVANKDHHYKTIITHGTNNYDDDLNQLKGQLQKHEHSTTEMSQKYCQLEAERSQLAMIVQKLDDKLAKTMGNQQYTNSLIDSLKDERNALIDENQRLSNNLKKGGHGWNNGNSNNGIQDPYGPPSGMSDNP